MGIRLVEVVEWPGHEPVLSPDLHNPTQEESTLSRYAFTCVSSHVMSDITQDKVESLVQVALLAFLGIIASPLTAWLALVRLAILHPHHEGMG